MWEERADGLPHNKLCITKHSKKWTWILEINYEKKYKWEGAATINAGYRVFSVYAKCFISYTWKDLTKSQVTQMRDAGNALKVISYLILFSWKWKPIPNYSSGLIFEWHMMRCTQNEDGVQKQFSGHNRLDSVARTLALALPVRSKIA